MGLEQILMPILGGVAKGVGTGLEEKRQQQQEAERQRNANMAAKFMKDPELFEEPVFRNWAKKYWGPEEAKAMYSIARVQRLQNQYLQDERVRTGNPNPDPSMMPADYIPPEPVFNDPAPAGSPGGIAGLISKFVPGAGAVMNTLGGLVGPGAAQAQMIPQVSSPTGPPSGPQGYPPPGGWQAAQPSTVNMGGPTPPFTPVSAAGGVAPAAAQVGMDERIGMGAVSRIPVTTATSLPGGGAQLVIQGTPPPPGTRRAFTSQRPQTIAKGVTIRFDKDGNQLISMAAVDDNLSTNMNEVSRRLIDARRPEGQKLDMQNADDLAEVLDYANELSMKVLASKNALTEEQKLRGLENPRFQAAQGALARTKAAGGAEGAYNIASRPDVVRFENQQKFDAAINTAQGTGAAENSIAVGPDGTPLAFDPQGNPMTLSQIRVAREVETTQRKEQATVLDTVTQKKLDGMKGMLASVDRIWQNYDPKFLGAVQGTKKALKWREITGLASGPESVMRQTMTALSNIKIQDLTGAGVTHEDGIRILAELPSPQDSPEVFVAKLANFQTMLGEALERVQQGATEPRSAQTPTPVPVPSAGARTPPINKDKTSKFYGQPMNTRTDVPLNDPSATAAPAEVVPIPAGMFKETPTPEEMASGNFAHKLTPEGVKALSDAAKRGDLRKGSVYEYVPQ